MNPLFLFSMSDQLHHWKGTLLVFGIGLVVGLICGLLMKWRSLGVFFSMLLGMVGSWLYHSFFTGYYTYSHSRITNEIIYSIIGAFVLTVVINLIFGSNKGRDRTFWRA